MEQDGQMGYLPKRDTAGEKKAGVQLLAQATAKTQTEPQRHIY
jgi:hypothetical protein